MGKVISSTDVGELFLVGIEGDTYTLNEDIYDLYNNLKNKKIKVKYDRFITSKGHESWITDITNFKQLLSKYV